MAGSEAALEQAAMLRWHGEQLLVARQPSLMAADGMLTANNGVHACCRSGSSTSVHACKGSVTMAGSEAAWQQAATLWWRERRVLQRHESHRSWQPTACSPPYGQQWRARLLL